MPEYKDTKNIYTIDQNDTDIVNEQYPPSLFLFRTVPHTPLTDPRGVMQCDCYMGNECYNYDHWKNRWVLLQPNLEYFDYIED